MEHIQSKNLAKHYFELKLKSTFGKRPNLLSKEPYPGLFTYPDISLFDRNLIGHIYVKSLKMTDLLSITKWEKTKVYQEILQLQGQGDFGKSELMIYIHCGIPMLYMHENCFDATAEHAFGSIYLDEHYFVPVDLWFKEVKEFVYDQGNEAPVEVVD